MVKLFENLGFHDYDITTICLKFFPYIREKTVEIYVCSMCMPSITDDNFNFKRLCGLDVAV